MIFRRRRTRIEIEQTTVKVRAGRPNSVAPRPMAVMPSAPSPVASVLARVLPFPAPEPNETNAAPSVSTIAARNAQETRP